MCIHGWRRRWHRKPESDRSASFPKRRARVLVTPRREDTSVTCMEDVRFLNEPLAVEIEKASLPTPTWHQRQWRNTSGDPVGVLIIQPHRPADNDSLIPNCQI